MKGLDAILDPYAPAAHHVCHHHVRREAIADDGNVTRIRDPGLRVVLEVVHDLVPAAGLLDAMGEDLYARGLL